VSRKLLITTATLAVTIWVAACEKTPSGDAGQSGSATSDAQHDQSTPAQSPVLNKNQSAQTQPAPNPPPASTRAANEGESKPDQQHLGKGPEQGSSENSGLGQTPDQAHTAAQTHSLTQSGAGESEPAQPQPKQAGGDQGQMSEPQNQQASAAANSSPEQGTTGPVNLSQNEIRQVQLVLKEKGFDPGMADGVLGPRTRRALIAFQRQQGFETSGQIDRPTLAALGVLVGAGSGTGTNRP
jgi:hypothetical protein